MKRIRTHEIGEEGEQLFESMLPHPWVKRKQQPDYGIDYLVELVKDGHLTAEEFAAQVKGTEEIHVVQGTIRFPLKVKDLTYYVDKRIQPVYLAVIDVKNHHGYYLFLQKYALEYLKGRNWRRKKTVMVQISPKDLLTNTDRFVTDLRRALKFMTDLRPGAIESAITAEKRRIESLDPRLGVEISVNEGRRNYHLKPVQPIEFNFGFRARKEEAAVKFDALLERGLPVKFGPGEITIDGMPLLAEELVKGAIVQFATRMPAVLSALALDEEGKCYGGIYGMTGELEGGRAECRFKGDLLTCPLIFGLTICSPKQGQRGLAKVGVRWLPDRWINRPITQLPYFHEVAAIIRVMCGEGALRIELAFEGRKFDVPHRFRDPHPVAARARGLIELLTKAREVACRLNMAPALPSELSREDVYDLDRLHQVIVRGEHRTKAAGMRLSITQGTEDLSGLIAATEGQGDGKPIAIKGTTISYRLLGERVDLTDCEVTWTSAKCISDVRRDAETVLAEGKNAITVKWEACEGAEMVVRRPFYPQSTMTVQ